MQGDGSLTTVRPLYAYIAYRRVVSCEPLCILANRCFQSATSQHLQMGPTQAMLTGSVYMANREAIAKFFFATGTAPELASAPAFDEMIE